MTDVKTARDVLLGHFEAEYGTREQAAWYAEAFESLGYQITPVRVDDGVRVEAALNRWFERTHGSFDQAMFGQGEKEVYRRRMSAAIAAADAVAGAGRDADARVAMLEEAAIICANIATEWQCCKRSENPTWEASMRAADECTDAIRAEIDVANADAGVERNGTVTIGFHPKEARFASAACRAEAERTSDGNDCVLLHIIADAIDAALAPAAGEVRS